MEALKADDFQGMCGLGVQSHQFGKDSNGLGRLSSGFRRIPSLILVKLWKICAASLGGVSAKLWPGTFGQGRIAF